MGFSVRERKDKSVYRHSLEACLAMATVASRGDAGQQVVEAARSELHAVDKAFEVVSRAARMLQQVLDGDWPIEEVSGVERALGTVLEGMTFLDGGSLCERVVNACNALGGLEEADQENIEMARAAITRFERAQTAMRAAISFLSGTSERRRVKDARRAAKEAKSNLH